MNNKYNEKVKLEMDNLYLELINAYLSTLNDLKNGVISNSGVVLSGTIAEIKMIKNNLEADEDTESLTHMTMWFIDGEGWLKYRPEVSSENDQLDYAINMCRNADELLKSKNYMNLDLQELAPNMRYIDVNNVDTYTDNLKEKEKIIKEKIENMKNEETKNNNVNSEEKTSNETTSNGFMSKLGKGLKYTAIGAVIGGIAIGGKILYDKVKDGEITIIDFK